MSGAAARVDCVVVGAGVVGLACARALAHSGQEVVVLERHDAIGTEISARNSEVIHAGIYYEADSLKARLCVEGRRRLYEYCESRGIAYRRCGKLIVAVSTDQEAELAAIAVRARTNGVDDLEALDSAAVRKLEPALRSTAALHSPSTGIVDSHGFMLALQGDAETAGAAIAFNTPFERATPGPDGFEIACGGAEPMRLAARRIVNAAGLGTQAIAGAIEGIPDSAIPARHLARGNYFLLQGRSPFRHLVYPVPEPGGLGVHLTLDLDGKARFGPDVEWIDSIGYEVDPRRGDGFYRSIRQYWPGLPDAALVAGYAGIRPKIAARGEPAADFRIDGPDRHGVAGLVNLFGIESPGLTSALAIADIVRDILTAQ